MVAKRSVALLVITSLVALSLLGCASVVGPEVTEEFHETYDLGPGARLDVENLNGSVRITTWDREVADVQAIKKSRYGQDELDRMRIEVSTVGGLSIQSVPEGRNVRVSVSYTIRVPEDTILSGIRTSNGDIEIQGGRGDVQVETSNGNVDVSHVDGYVSARSSNGDITIGGTTGLTDARTSNGRINAEILSIRGDVRVSSSNGSIRLNIAPDLNADIEASTSNGSVTLHDLEVTVSRTTRTSLEGRLGSGGSTIRVTTSNGSIDLYRLNTQ